MRFAIVAGFLWGWASFAEAEEKPLVTIDQKGRAVAREDAPEVVKKAVAAGNRLVGLPYRMGGGHAKLNDSGYDCSGAVSYVLRELGAMEGARPSGGFLTFGEKGEGDYVTVWAKKGHVFLTVGGVRFDTQGTTAEDGPRWTTKSRDKKKFVARRLPKK